MADVSVSRTIDASPEQVWALVSDPTRMGDWSPENTGASWLDGATEAAVGARFRGSNAKGRLSWNTTCTVVECAADEAFAFDVGLGPLPISTWGFRLAGENGNTEVTQEFTNREPAPIAKAFNLLMRIKSSPEHNRRNMEATLAALAAELEA